MTLKLILQYSNISKYYFIFLTFYIVLNAQTASAVDWNESELALLKLQLISNLPALPPAPGNRYANVPAVAKLGQKIFFDERFSVNGKVACATCHLPAESFTDGLAKSRGTGETSRSAPNILGVAYSPWFFWDGRSDSLWSQALGPLESAVEHGGSRSQYARIIYNNSSYRKTYEDLFDPLPDLSDIKRFPVNAAPIDDKVAKTKWQAMSSADRKLITRVFVNIGKAIAAYESLLKPGTSRFDKYVESILDEETRNTEHILTTNEISGLKLFIGKAMCITCHQGPLFTNHGFHNVAVPDPAAIKPKYMLPLFYTLIGKPAVDSGRFIGIQQALNSEFNCLSVYSDANEDDCAELKYANKNRNEILAAFKVPTLRNITKTAPYMHAGQFTNLAEALKHYNSTPRSAAGQSELMPVNLTDNELKQIEAFLHSLDSPPDVDAELLRSP